MEVSGVHHDHKVVCALIMEQSDPSPPTPGNREDSAQGSSSIDHVLLESLFYNEMMLMDDPSSSLFSSLSSELSGTVDPGTIAEKALLRDFGVSEESQPEAVHSLPGSSARSGSIDQTTTQTRSPAVSDPSIQQQQQLLKNRKSRGIRHRVTSVSSRPTPVGQPAASAPVQALSPPPAYQAATAPAGDREEKRNKLVSQFATLASRLGINLPPEVLDSLTNKQAACGNTGIDTSTMMRNSSTDAPVGIPSVPAAKAGFAPAPGVAGTSAGTQQPPAVKQLESTAEAAIAAVAETSRKRSVPEVASSLGVEDATAATSRPTYSKRRKKPRLQDCEEKLALLKSENELLKRHLSTLSNKSHKTDLERQELEQRMRRMLSDHAPQEEMDALVQKFSDYYSDYGKRRHQELAFHLDQLQRLANPTNVTKMGLWTLGQQSKDQKQNPIVGILWKELGMTTQQGRKILEQRQRIKDVCMNLSEVRNTAQRRLSAVVYEHTLTIPLYTVPWPAQQAERAVRTEDENLSRSNEQVP